jgi:hypothetical protein
MQETSSIFESVTTLVELEQLNDLITPSCYGDL